MRDRGVHQPELLGEPRVIRGGSRAVDLLEVGAPVLAERVADRLAGEPGAEPGPLHLGHMPDQTEQ